MNDFDYEVDFSCDNNSPQQHLMSNLYEYGEDIGTRVFHNNRIILFKYLLDDLIRRKLITRFDSAIDLGCNAGIYSKIISNEREREKNF